MAVQRGRSERRGESYSEPYVEPLSDTRTKLADFFNILLISPFRNRHRAHPDSHSLLNEKDLLHCKQRHT